MKKYIILLCATVMSTSSVFGLREKEAQSYWDQAEEAELFGNQPDEAGSDLYKHYLKEQTDEAKREQRSFKKRDFTVVDAMRLRELQERQRQENEHFLYLWRSRFKAAQELYAAAKSDAEKKTREEAFEALKPKLSEARRQLSKRHSDELDCFLYRAEKEANDYFGKTIPEDIYGSAQGVLFEELPAA